MAIHTTKTHGQIYAMSDPRNPNIPRYVGRTVRTLRDRLKSHKCWVKKNPSHPFSKWFIALIQEGLFPNIYSLERDIKVEDLQSRETHWILFFRPLGTLTNRSDGDGMKGLKNTLSELNKQITHPKLKESNRKRMKPVIGENGVRFNSISEARKSLGVSEWGFRDCVNNHWRVKGVYWKILESEDT